MLLRFSPKVDHIKTIYLIKEAGTVVYRNSVLLVPGVNEVTDDEYKCMVRSIMNELDTKEIVPLVSKIPQKMGGFKTVKNLIELPVKQAVAYVADCTSADTLTKWYKEEVREEVRVQIVAKFEELGIDKPISDIPEVNEHLVSQDEVNEIVGITTKSKVKEEPEVEVEEIEPETEEDIVESEETEEASEAPKKGRRGKK